MRFTVLGGQGAWPTADAGCSGYLLEHDGHRILIDPGWGTVAALPLHTRPSDIDAVVVSHGHPDHCADLVPLLRARTLGSRAVPRLPVYAPAEALDAVLATDPVSSTARGAEPVAVDDGDEVQIGPCAARFVLMPHHVTNLACRLVADGRSVYYSGDSGPSPAQVELGRGADLFVVEATMLDQVDAEDRGLLNDVRTACRLGSAAAAGLVLLTHLWPGASRHEALRLARSVATAPVDVAVPGWMHDW